jgi:hypothetical protein
MTIVAISSKLQHIVGSEAAATLSPTLPSDKSDDSPSSTRTDSDSPIGDTQDPNMKTGIRHYIFGYGSLICSKSRKISAPTLTKPAIPVVVHHLRRTWTARVGLPKHRSPEEIHDEIHGQTAMGIQQSQGQRCTGVLIEVDTQELANFDERERGYDRVEIDLLHVFPHDEDGDDHHVIQKSHQRRTDVQTSEAVNDDINDKVWVYLPQGGGDGANDYYPIMQSYVDIILRGCLSIGEEFALSFLESTHGWWHESSVHGPESEVPEFLWLDDRHDPYYIRADEKWSEEMKHFIDDLIKQVHPEPFEKRRHLDTLEISQ